MALHTTIGGWVGAGVGVGFGLGVGVGAGLGLGVGAFPNIIVINTKLSGVVPIMTVYGLPENCHPCMLTEITYGPATAAV